MKELFIPTVIKYILDVVSLNSVERIFRMFNNRTTEAKLNDIRGSISWQLGGRQRCAFDVVSSINFTVNFINLRAQFDSKPCLLDRFHKVVRLQKLIPDTDVLIFLTKICLWRINEGLWKLHNHIDRSKARGSLIWHWCYICATILGHLHQRLLLWNQGQYDWSYISYFRNIMV